MSDCRARNWFITLNNYTEEEEACAMQYKCQYICIGKEIGEKCNTPHLHIYFELKNAKSFSKIKKEFPRANIQVAKGNGEQARQYCSKQELLYESGAMKKAGERTDLQQARDVLEDTGKMSDVVAVATSFQSVRMCECYLKYHERTRNWKPVVKWYYGTTGTGKTKTAYEECSAPYTTGKTIKWWEGYDAHEEVIIDDFRKTFCSFEELLKLLDRYAYRVECKGGSRQLLATKIIITSAYSPQELYCDSEENINQLLRRIDEIKIFRNIIKNGEERETETD